ncbi:hypothetical protein VZT92_009352 [Zoarces viviparus]|uniref:Uncharacterized protein n=1 Tax=Zoarces viviparus TaxID=48416 RepID=A0AAW1FHP5_ZOAVI
MLTRSGSDTPGHTGHVLIQSTRVFPSNQRHEAGTGPAPGPGPGPGPVQITIQKLRQKPGQAPPPRAAGSSQSGGDVVTSRFGAGARGLVLAALKHRCNSDHSDLQTRLQVTHLDPTAGLLQQTSRAASIAVETRPVTMATPHHDQWTDTSR